MPSVTRSQADHSSLKHAAEGTLKGFAVGLTAVAGVLESRLNEKGGRSRMCSVREVSVGLMAMMERRLASVYKFRAAASLGYRMTL